MRSCFSKSALLATILFVLAMRSAWGEGGPSAAPAAPLPDPQSTYSLETEREPVSSLDGQWRFQQGDDLSWAEPGFDDSKWSLVQSGSDWQAMGFAQMSGTAWYRFRVVLPAGDQSFSLRLPVIFTSYQVFANGRLLLTEGSMPPHASLYRARPVLVPLSTGQRSIPEIITIALRVWHDPTWSRYRHGGLQGSAEVGRTDLLQSRFTSEQQAHLWQYSDDLDLGALEMLAFGIALALYIARRSEREFLWFALFALGEGGTHLVTAWGHLHANSIVFDETLQVILNTVFLAAALMFFLTLFRGRWGNAFVFALVCLGLGALLLPLFLLGTLSIQQSNWLSLGLHVPVYGWIVVFVRQQGRRGEADARVLRGPLTFLFASALYTELLWALETSGFTYFKAFETHWRHPFYVTLDDLAESIFLLAILYILLRRLALRSREQDRVHSELEAARSVQQVLVPESLPRIAGLSIGTAFHPAQEVGGDFFQILPKPSGATLIVIGDVAGKGLPAALQVSLCVGAIRALAECSESPAEILSGLNRSLQGRGPGFTTCLALLLSEDRSTLTFANAGHIAPYVNGFELRTEPNLPLGLIPAANYDEVRYSLHPGDHLTVLTDGVPEATHEKELFGFDRTGALSRQSATAIAEAACSFGQTDDITVLTIDIVDVPSSHTEQLQPALQPA